MVAVLGLQLFGNLPAVAWYTTPFCGIEYGPCPCSFIVIVEVDEDRESDSDKKNNNDKNSDND